VGQPRVTDCESVCDGFDADTVLQLAATVESGARHPLAEAIGTQASDRQLSLRSAEDFRTEAGLGVSALIDGDRVWVGSSSGLEQSEIAIDPPVRDRAQALASEGKTVVYVAKDKTVIGLIAARDRLRDRARQTVEQLQQWGLQVMLLTGDRPQAAEAIATEVGIAPANVIARVRPEEKARAIAELQGQNRQVAMVGDGINDAPALAQANVGISLHGGTDVAIETAQIVLMQANLLDLVESIRLSRATFAKIRQNLFWAFAYNTVGIPVAAGALLPGFGIAFNPAVAAALMAFSSVSVVTNSLLLRHQFRSSQPPA
jgi:Cu2+-exporting ATPase